MLPRHPAFPGIDLDAAMAPVKLWADFELGGSWHL